MDTSQTIPTQKAAFLRSQIRLLSAPLQPSSTWSSDQNGDSGVEDEGQDRDDIPVKTVNDVLSRLNDHLAIHNRAAYPPQTQRYIVEQIDKLYWKDITSKNSTAGSGDANANSVETVIAQDLDLAGRNAPAVLPEVWDDLFVDGCPPPPPIPSLSRPEQRREYFSQSFHDHRPDAYAAMRSRLDVLLKEQEQQRGRLQSYRQLEKLLKPFEQKLPVEIESEGDDQHLRDDDDGAVDLHVELARMKSLVGRMVDVVGAAATSSAVPSTDTPGIQKNGIQNQPDNLRLVMKALAQS